MRYDYDWLVIGSGFGGSVAALRLAEKGHRVGVRRMRPALRRRRLRQDRLEPEALLLGPAARAARDLPDDALPRRLHRLGLGRRRRQPRLREHPLPRAAGVLPRPQWAGLGGWDAELAPALRHRRADARRDRVPRRGPRRPAAQGAAARSWASPRPTSRPASASTSASPARRSRTRSSAARARRGAAASAAGAAWSAAATAPRTRSSRTTSGSPSASAPRSCPSARSPTSSRSAPPTARRATASTTEHPGAWVRKRRRTFTARGVVVAAGALGTNRLLARCKLGGSLPRLSDRLGDARAHQQRVDPRRDRARRRARLRELDRDHLEHLPRPRHAHRGRDLRPRRRPDGAACSRCSTGEGTRRTRPFMWLGQALRHPIRLLRTLWPFKWSRRTVILLVMQTLDNAIRLRPKRGAARAWA